MSFFDRIRANLLQSKRSVFGDVSKGNYLEILENGMTVKNYCQCKKEFRSGVTYSQTQTVVIANTADETSMINRAGAIGSTNFPSDYFKLGKVTRYKISGFITALNNTEATLRLKLGGTAFITSVGIFSGVRSEDYFDIEFMTICQKAGSDGKFIGQGRSLISGGIGLSTAAIRKLGLTTPLDYDTTQNYDVDITYQWTTASASNSLTVTNMFFETLA